MSTKSIAFLIIFAIIVFGAGYYYKTKYAPTEDTSDINIAVASTQKIGAKTLILLNQVNSLNLDTSIFDNEIFRNLKEYPVLIPDQPVGRINPFAPYVKSGTGGPRINLPPVTNP